MQVEIRDGQLVGTLGRQLPSKQTARGCSRLLSEMVTASFFGGGSLLNGEGDLQVGCWPPHTFTHLQAVWLAAQTAAGGNGKPDTNCVKIMRLSKGSVSSNACATCSCCHTAQ